MGSASAKFALSAFPVRSRRFRTARIIPEMTRAIQINQHIQAATWKPQTGNDTWIKTVNETHNKLLNLYRTCKSTTYVYLCNMKKLVKIPWIVIFLLLWSIACWSNVLVFSQSATRKNIIRMPFITGNEWHNNDFALRKNTPFSIEFLLVPMRSGTWLCNYWWIQHVIANFNGCSSDCGIQVLWRLASM